MISMSCQAYIYSGIAQYILAKFVLCILTGYLLQTIKLIYSNSIILCCSFFIFIHITQIKLQITITLLYS